MSTTQIAENKSAASIVISKQLLNKGADAVERLQLNGVKQRDKELVVINLFNRINNGQRPDWQALMEEVEEIARKNNTQPRVVAGRIVDHLFQRERRA